jgi:predicted MarR family transcription regulator
MKLLTSGIIAVTSAGLLMLGACSKEAKTSDSTSPNSTTNPTAAMANDGQMEKSHMSPKKGGQVVESGKYHLELVPEKAASSTHLDFYILRGDNHQSVPNAKVTADLQSPDGKQKTLPFNYDASGKHYAAVVSDKSTGQYQVKIMATIGNEKVDGRFNFDR